MPHVPQKSGVFVESLLGLLHLDYVLVITIDLSRDNTPPTNSLVSKYMRILTFQMVLLLVCISGLTFCGCGCFFPLDFLAYNHQEGKYAFGYLSPANQISNASPSKIRLFLLFNRYSYTVGNLLPIWSHTRWTY